MDKNRVTIETAASELGMSVLTVRCLMQQERLPIGYALKRDGAKRWGYYIFRTLLDAEKDRLGIKN